VGKEVSGDMKANSAQGRQQHGQNKVVLPGKGSLMFRGSYSSQLTTNYRNNGMFANLT
jgi:hypothetical protein